MKKRILALAVVLALVAVMVMPMAALAGSVSVATVTVVPATAGVVNADYTIVFTTDWGVVAASTVTIVFPEGTGVATNLAGTINTNNIITAVGTPESRTVVITVPDDFVAVTGAQSGGAQTVTVVLTTGITNPLAGAKTLVVGTTMDCNPGTTSASYTITGATTTTDVSGTLTIPVPVLTLTVPSAVTLANLYGSSGDEVGTTTVGTVLSTLAGGYTLYLASNQAEGKLMLGGSGTTTLNQPLKIRPTSPGTALLATGTGAAVTGAAWAANAAATTTATIVGATAGSGPDGTGTNTITLTVAQPKQATGASGTYSYILTWSISAN